MLKRVEVLMDIGGCGCGWTWEKNRPSSNLFIFLHQFCLKYEKKFVKKFNKQNDADTWNHILTSPKVINVTEGSDFEWRSVKKVALSYVLSPHFPIAFVFCPLSQK